MALLPPPTHAKIASGRALLRLLDLRARFLADHFVKFAHHHRIRMRPERRAQQVVCGRYVRHPVAHGFADGVLERAAPARYSDHLCPQQSHAENIQPLPPHVFFAHVDHAFQTEQRAHRGCSYAVLARAGFRNDALLSHAPR